MTNKQIARNLKLTADLIELTGGNSFRARAYAAASRTVNALEEPVVTLLAAGEGLASVQGIGDGIARDISSLLDSGSFETLDELLAAVPPGVLDILRIRGLGPRKVRTLWDELGITDLDELEAAAIDGRIASLAGFGAKSSTKIIDEIERIRSYSGLYHYATALRAAQPLMDALRDDAWIERAEYAGAIRRGLEVASEVEMVISGDYDAVRAIVNRHTSAEDSGDGAVRMLPGAIPVTLHLVDDSDFVSTLWRRTGSQSHVEAIERSGPINVAATTERALYEALGLQFIPPELREGEDAIASAKQGSIPHLIELSDLRGVIHNHTTASDGVNTLREMADEARALGFEYLGICDHSRSLVIANGLTIERLLKQGEEIAELNAALAAEGVTDFSVLHGSEVDILADGSLDFPDEALADLDLVVASIHSRFEMTEQEATERLLAAIANPYTDILGHPTGRLILRREGYPIDYDAVIDACARHNVAIELNANPYRLDIDWRHIRKAIEAGVLISINPDAHSTDELSYSEWGVAVARKGWLTRELCLNALPLTDFRNWVSTRRNAHQTVASAK